MIQNRVQQMVQDRDIVGLTSIITYDGYLPVRWDPFIDRMPISSLRLLLPKLDGDNLERALYRIGDPTLFKKYKMYKPNYELASKYRYVPHIRVPSESSTPEVIRQAIAGLPIETLMGLTNDRTYHIFLDHAFREGRLDYIQFVMDRYNVDKVNIPPPWEIPLAVYEWLDMDRRMTARERLMTAIKHDDLKAYIDIGGMPIMDGIHGKILHHIIESTDDTAKLDMLKMDADAISHGIQYMPTLAHYYLARAMAQGYFDILDMYMNDGDVLRVAMDRRVTNIGIPDSIITYLDHRYDDPIGTWLQCYTTHGECGHMDAPHWFWRQLMLMASMNGDIHTMRNILHNHHPTDEDKRDSMMLMKEYISHNSVVYSVLAAMLLS